MDVFAAELYEVLPRANWSRRGFLVTSLATGFALAAGPISAETITTDTIGLDVAEVKVPTADGEMPAYRAMPATGGPFATILVVQEIFASVRSRRRRAGAYRRTSWRHRRRARPIQRG
jgi:carboxymethylenebutenolidase